VLDGLARDEREHAAAIAGDRERTLWSRSRGVLRALLARYTSGEAGALELRIGPRGKPELSGRSGRDPFFNLSHSSNLALYAFCSDGEIGVDIQALRNERRRARVDHIGLARRAFGEHEARRLSLLAPELREREFLRAWTRHEAELKRLGTGIGGGGCDGGRLDGAGGGGCDGGRLGGAGAGGRSDDRHKAPVMVELDVGPEAAAALALERNPVELHRWAWA
jgi:4'-phosphopantetheinyl transferase superfamily